MLRAAFARLAAGAFLLLGSVSFAADSGNLLDAIDKAAGQTPFQKPHVTAEIIAENDSLTPRAVNRLAVVLHHEEGWHTYWKMPGDAGLPTTFEFSVPSGWSTSEPAHPLPERDRAGGLTSFGYSGEAIFPFTLDVPRTVRFGDRATVKVHVEFLVCREMCVPGSADASIRLPLAVAGKPSPNAQKIADALKLVPEPIEGEEFAAEIEDTHIRIDLPAQTAEIRRSLDFLPLDSGALNLLKTPRLVVDETNRALYLEATEDFAKTPTETLRGVFVADGGPAEGGWAVETTVALAAGSVTPPIEEAPLEVQLPEANADLTLGTLSALLFAFAGGLILNLMPCVFPVLSLKLLQLVEGARRGEGLLGHGFAFTIGVALTMLVLSGVLMALRSAGMALGWGFQLQSPSVVATLLVLFVAISLNLWGVFEFTFGVRAADADFVRSAPKSGIANSFLTGVLAVIVASPCTAPFMGAALGYALTQPALEAMAVFLSLGLGMALPWLLLCIFPSWAKWLPKPGAWMNTFRKAMAVPMVLAALWLAWVLSKQIDYRGMLVLAAGAGACVVFFWLIGREQWGLGRNRPILVLTGALVVATVFATGLDTFAKRVGETAHTDGWAPWSEMAVTSALQEGRPVFIDFTAAWCVTCQANKLAVLRTDAVEKRLEELGYVKLVGDWTNRNAEIAAVLAEFGRSGVPLYLIYRPDGTVEVLPELLTPAVVLEALDGKRS